MKKTLLLLAILVPAAQIHAGIFISKPKEDSYDPEKPSPFNDLPSEIILCIFSYLSLTDVYNTTFTCKQFSTIMRLITKKHTPDEIKKIIETQRSPKSFIQLATNPQAMVEELGKLEPREKRMSLIGLGFYLLAEKYL